MSYNMKVGHVDSPLIDFGRLNYKGIYWPFSMNIQKNRARKFVRTHQHDYRTLIRFILSNDCS